MKTISLDTETFYDTKAGYGVRELGSYNYTRDERFDCYMISVSDGTETWAGDPKNFNWDSLDGVRLLSHNSAFDRAVLEAMAEKGLAPKVNFAEWLCTANMAAYLCNRRSLAHASEYLLKVGVSKELRNYADGKRWADIVADGKGGKMLEYARGDAFRCRQLFDKFGDQWPAHERALSELTIRHNTRGVQIDYAKLQKQLGVAQTALLIAEMALPWMKEGRKPTSPKAVAEECRKVGIPCPPVKSRDGEDAFDAWAATYAPKYQWIKAYCDYRVIAKYIGTLETIKAKMTGEQVFPFELLYFGAHTGRWAGAGGFNMQNMRKDPLVFDDKGWLITDSERLGEIAKSKGSLPGYVSDVLDIRSLFIPRPGKKMIVSDLSQIEPRVLAWLTGDKFMLDAMRAGQSPYEAHARASMGWTGGDLKTEDKDQYQLAKIQVLGLGYGCGWEKFITIASQYGIDLTEGDREFIPVRYPEGQVCLDKDGLPIMRSGYGETSRGIVNDYRAAKPLVTGLWRQLDEAFKNSVGGDFEIELPSGRKLRYPEVRRERKAVADPENPNKFSYKWVVTALLFDGKRNGVVRKPLYGGLLTENLVQATARDVFAHHLLTLDKTSGVDVLWSVHDEAVLEVDEHVSAKDVEAIMSECPEWIKGCPIGAEAAEVPHYKK